MFHSWHQYLTFHSRDADCRVCVCSYPFSSLASCKPHSHLTEPGAGGMRDKNLLSCVAFFSNQGRKQELMSQGHKQDAVILTQWKRDGDPEAKEQSPSMCSPPPSSVSEHVRPLIGVTMMMVGRKRPSAIRLGQVTEQRSEGLQVGD